MSYSISTRYQVADPSALIEKAPEIREKAIAAGGPPPLSWSSPIVRERRISDVEQATQTGRDCHKVAAG